MSNISCLNCKHLDFRPGCEGWSEWTPGWPSEWICNKQHFEEKIGDEGDRLEDTEGVFDPEAEARLCPDFEQE